MSDHKSTQPASRQRLNAVDEALTQLQHRLERTRATDGLGDARRHMQSGRFAEAKTVFDALLPACPHMDQVWLQGAQLADAMGESSVAVDRFRHAMSLDTELKNEAEEGLMNALIHAGDLSAAGRVAFMRTRRNANDIEAWATLAMSAMHTGRSRLMWRTVENLRHATDDHTARQAMAAAWRSTGPFMPIHQQSEADGGWNNLVAWAANTLSMATKRMPRHADKHYHHAVCSLASGQPRVAEKSVKQALKLNPSYTSAMKLHDRLQDNHDDEDNDSLPFAQAA